MQENVERIVCGNGNSYLISRGRDAVLVDTGRAPYREKLLAACAPYRVRLLVLTHGHMDHIQNAAFLSERLEIPIAMSRADLALIDDNLAQPLRASTLPGRLVLAASLRSFRRDHIPPFRPDIFLADGDTLEPYGISARVTAVPGHTDGSIVLDVGREALLVGDALMNLFYPTVSMLYRNRAAMLQSAEKLSRFGGRTIYFGHGRPVKNRQWVRPLS